MIKKTLAVIAPLLLFFSCAMENQEIPGNPAENKIYRTGWLLGKWQGTSGDAEIYEHWEKLNDSTYNGQGLFINRKDTLLKEQLTIAQQGNDLFYIPTIRNQNEGKPVYFKLTRASENYLVFENPMHDFPQKISYKKISADSLEIKISGTNTGKERSEIFIMKRVNL